MHPHNPIQGDYDDYLSIVMMTMMVIIATLPHNPNQGDYDNQLPTFRGCAGTAFPHDEKCAYEKQVKK